MDRKMYEPTERQEQKWAALAPVEMPSDDEFRTTWTRKHHGKLVGWGMGKRDWIVNNLKNCREYQMGLWQGAVDAARGLSYQREGLTDDNINCYNLGYYRGYTGYQSNRRGWDAQTRTDFDSKYLTD